MATGDTDTSVQVALRIRPQNAREQIDMCRVCTYCTPDTPQIVLGKDKAFTYDYVFDTVSYQEQIYSTCVEELVNGCFDGYNATVLAYGQTGSGKTYTMGTGFDMAIHPDELGMIPRAVGQIFSGIDECKRSALEKGEPLPHFEVKTQFLELYNEEIIDLLEEQNKGKLRIHEDAVGNIYVAGATELTITSEEETLACLKRGALSRTVGSTNMNAQSSRSHAIFSLILVHQRLAVRNPVDDQSNEEESIMNNGESSSSTADWETLKAKFHFVDLAGSERLKRTGATGERAKEGISINCGLLALGNVISALGDKMKKGSHVPYRDSKLTRLLQDSLGGNSKTLMIACISPTDRDFMETLNTLKYSNRARNIKNKVVVNQDKMSQQLTALRSKIQQLEVELQEFRSGRMIVSGDGSVVVNDMANEITMLRTENDKLRLRVKAMQQVVESQSNSIASLTAERDCLTMGHQDESTGQVVSNSNRDSSSDNFTKVIHGYITQIEELKSRLILSESMAHQSRQAPAFHRAASTVQAHFSGDRQFLGSVTSTDTETSDLLKLAKDNIEKLKEKGKKELMAESRSQPAHKKGHVPVLSEADSSLEESSDDGSDDTEETMTVQVSSSDESESDKEETASLASSVAELSSEINLKQQLVEQLEKAQRNIYTMRTQYEDKMQVLQQQIKSTESERDRVLKDMSTHRSHERSDEKVKDIKLKYERQLNDLKTELKTLKSAKKEHAKAIRKNAQHEKDLKIMKNELLEMKKQRVKMLNKMREEANHRKMDEAKRTKEIRQLQKERRTKEHKIQLLESDAKRKELVLKRRQEELAALRRNNRYKRDRPALPTQSSLESSQTPLSRVEFATNGPGNYTNTSTNLVSASETASGYGATVVFRRQTGNRDIGSAKLAKRRMSSIFSSESAKKKWRNLEKKVLDATNKRQTMANLSKDMDTWIEKRDQLSRKVDDLRKQKQAFLQSEELEVAGIEEDMDSLSAHIEYVQENIVELQNDLIAVDDVKCDGDTVEAHSLISSCSPKEAKYLLEHLLDKVLNLGVKASQTESDVKSLEARLKASEQSAEIIQSLSSPQVSSTAIPLTASKLKSLTQCRAMYSHSLAAIEEASSKVKPSDSVDGSRTRSESTKDIETSPRRGRHAVSLTELPSMQDKKAANDKDKHQLKATHFSKDSSPTDDDEKIGDKVTSRRRGGSGGSCDSKKKSTSSSNDVLSSMGNQTVNSCPPSPSLGAKLSRSAADGGVWSRLTSSASAAADSSKGVLQSERVESRRSGTGKLLYCTHTASGHSASVLSVCATQNYLFSASQDRTVKIWNLKSCTELLTLDKHFSYVRCVRFCPKNNIIFTASQSLIKLWDMRHHRARCINTFGLNSTNGVSVGAEYAVQDLIVSPSGDMLYSASGNFINIWDLKKSKYLGRFVGHNGALCALAIKGNLMATGARDRLIKLYDLETIDTSSMINQPSICTLYPPHYDAVSSLALYNDLLFSSCGVTIKQWDIKERSLKQALDGAHSPGSTINSLAIFNSPLTPLLVSGCKGGVMKLWNPETCAHLGEIVSHKSSINSISTNGTCIFTGSSDKTVKIWRPSPQDS